MSDPPFDKDSFHRAVTNGDFSQAPLKQRYPLFYSGTSLFCCLPIPHSSMEPFKPPPRHKQDFNRFREASSHVIFPFQRKFLLSEISRCPFIRIKSPQTRFTDHHKQDLLVTTRNMSHRLLQLQIIKS